MLTGILLSISLTSILNEGVSVFFLCFLGYIQHRLEYLIQDMTHQVIQTLHSMSELIL